MSKVWKRFLFKVAIIVSFISYVFVVVFSGGYISYALGYSFEAGLLIGAGSAIVIPIFFIILRDIYDESKREIEWEDKYLKNNELFK